MKKIGICSHCGRSIYTNDLDLCKRCNQEFGAEVTKQKEAEEPKEVEEEGPSLEELGLTEGSEEEKDSKDEDPAEKEE